MQRVREMQDSSGDARRGRQQEGEARHKATQYPRWGRQAVIDIRQPQGHQNGPK
jgi:hypothetical protein